MRMPLIPCVVLCVMLALCVPASGQQSSPQDQASSPENRHVLIPVFVSDDSGRAITGLHADDFLIRHGRTETQPSGVDEVEGIGPSRGGMKSPAFVALDETSIYPPEVGARSRPLLEFLAKSVRQGDAIGLFSLTATGLRVAHYPNTPTAVSVAALQRLDPALGRKSTASSNPDEQLEIQQVDAALARLMLFGQDKKQYTGVAAAIGQLSSLKQLAGALHDIPGRKALLLVTDYLYVTVPEADDRVYFRGIATMYQENLALTALYQSTVQALNEARISVYPLLLYSEGGRAHNLDILARATGGTFLRTGPDITAAANKAKNDCGPYYLLSYDAPATNRVQWHKVKVDVRNAVGKVRAPGGIFLLPRTP